MFSRLASEEISVRVRGNEKKEFSNYEEIIDYFDYTVQTKDEYLSYFEIEDEDDQERYDEEQAKFERYNDNYVVYPDCNPDRMWYESSIEACASTVLSEEDQSWWKDNELTNQEVTEILLNKIKELNYELEIEDKESGLSDSCYIKVGIPTDWIYDEDDKKHYIDDTEVYNIAIRDHEAFSQKQYQTDYCFETQDGVTKESLEQEWIQYILPNLLSEIRSYYVSKADWLLDNEE